MGSEMCIRDRVNSMRKGAIATAAKGGSSLGKVGKPADRTDAKKGQNEVGYPPKVRAMQ